MNCALWQVLCQRLDQPEHQQFSRELISRYVDSPDNFQSFLPTLELSLPKELGFDIQDVRRTCDTCALNPLEECKLADLIIAAVRDRASEGFHN